MGAELDVVLSRKLRAPGQPEVAIGAIAEDGEVYLNHYAPAYVEGLKEYLSQERQHQFAEIAHRQSMFRPIRPRAKIAGRSVIVADDGIATGSTMIAALQSARQQEPRKLIAAAPVAPRDRLDEVRRWCDEVVVLDSPEDFWAVGQFYLDFGPVEDEFVIRLLREFAAARPQDVIIPKRY